MIDSVLSLTHCLYTWRYYNHNNISSMMPIVFSACLSENRGIRVSHRILLRYFTVCTQSENLRVLFVVYCYSQTISLTSNNRKCCHLRSRPPIKPCHVISYGHLFLLNFLSQLIHFIVGLPLNPF